MERITVEAAVSAASRRMQAARLPLQNYFGARETTILSEHGFLRGSQIGSELFRLTRISSLAGDTRTGL